MNGNANKNKRTAVIVIIVIVALLTLLGVFVVPHIVKGAGMIGELFGYAKEYVDDKQAVKDEEEGYETGMTEEGYYRFVVSERWNVYGTACVVRGDSEKILRCETYNRGTKYVADFIPLKDGTADIVTAMFDAGDETYELMHITVSGGKVSGYNSDKLNAVQYEELTGKEAYGWDYSLSLRDLKNDLEKAGLSGELNPPATEQAVEEWENESGCRLPEEYRYFLVFSDGFRHGSVITIYSLAELSKDNRPEGCEEGCFVIGETADSWLIFTQNGSVAELGKNGSGTKEWYSLCREVNNLVWMDLKYAEKEETGKNEKNS